MKDSNLIREKKVQAAKHSKDSYGLPAFVQTESKPSVPQIFHVKIQIFYGRTRKSQIKFNKRKIISMDLIYETHRENTAQT